ncbi:MAG: hypothetical protein ACKN82_05655, partial [Pirellula sp.]
MLRKLTYREFPWVMALALAHVHWCIGFAQEKTPESEKTLVKWRLPEGVAYEHIVRQEPRPLHIHVLKIDTRVSGLSFAVVPGDDPDGDGPAEVALAHPRDLAKKVDAIAAINTAAWAMLTDPKTNKKPGYIVGG